MPVFYLVEQGATLRKEGDLFTVTKNKETLPKVRKELILERGLKLVIPAPGTLSPLPVVTKELILERGLKLEQIEKADRDRGEDKLIT
jgi:hypothetical protein